MREPGDAGDLLARDREHHDAVGLVLAGLLVLRIGGQRRLAVGTCRQQPDAVDAAVERHGGEESGNGGGAVDPHRLGRHGHQRVAGEELEDPVDVDRLPRVLEAPHHARLGLGRRGRVHARERPLLPLAPEPLAGSLQRAVDGRDAVVEELGHLARRPVEDVAQHENRTLPGWKQLHGGHERQTDCLARLRARRRLGAGGHQRLRVGLEVRVDRHGIAALALFDHAQAHVGGDAVQPCGDRRARLEPSDPAPGPQQRLLQRVVGIVQRPKEAVAVGVQRRPVRRCQLDERPLVTLTGGAEEIAVIDGHAYDGGTGGGPPSSVHDDA
jgi:hypothetical protein